MLCSLQDEPAAVYKLVNVFIREIGNEIIGNLAVEKVKFSNFPQHFFSIGSLHELVLLKIIFIH